MKSLILTVFILFFAPVFAAPRFEANAGWIDFQAQSWTGPLALEGPWDFYWAWLWSKEKRQWPRRLEERVSIVRPWTDFIDPVSGERRSLESSATYRLHLTGLLPRSYRLRFGDPEAQMLLYREGDTGELRRAHPRRGELVLEFSPADSLESWVLIVEKVKPRLGIAPWPAPTLE